MSDVPFYVGAKTGSAQVSNKTKENAFFAGYATRAPRNTPTENAGDAEIAILILVEDARIGSLNTIPIAEDVLRWYYEHRMQ
jgi:cell division protein FtsI/penicillin-binding protein 2